MFCTSHPWIDFAILSLSGLGAVTIITFVYAVLTAPRSEEGY